MARQQIISYNVVCDVCGKVVAADDVDHSGRRLSWQGTDYAVELCSVHSDEFDQARRQLKIFVDAGKPVPTRSHRAQGSRRPARQAMAGRSDVAAVRVWARENGHTVGSRGRIAPDVLAAYDEAHRAADAASAPKKRGRRKVVSAA